MAFIRVALLCAALMDEASAQGLTAKRSAAESKLRTDAQLVRDVWTADNGLPQNSVQAIALGSNGYLWLGTQEGFARFDGVRFYSVQNPNFLANKNLSVKSLLAASDGSIWLGMECGLSRFKNGDITSYTTETGLPNDYVMSLLEDETGAIWIGTRGGVARFQNGKFSKGVVETGLGESYIAAIARTRDGSLWFGGKQGLTRFRDGSLQRFGVGDGLTINRITALYEDRSGALWIGSEDEGVNLFKDGRFTAFQPKAQDGGGPLALISDFQEGPDGRMWIATRNGLRYFDGQGLFDYSRQDPLFERAITSLCLDQEGGLWVGSLENGLIRIRKPKFPVYGLPEGLTGNFIQCVLEDRRGSLWVSAYQKGLTQITGQKLSYWDKSSGLPDDTVGAIHETRAGVLWFGTRRGIAAFRNGRFESYRQADGLVDDNVFAIEEDLHGGLWIATSNGVSLFRDGKFDNSWNREGLAGAVVRELLVARNGTVWVPTTTSGLFRIQDGQVKRYTTRDGLPSNQIIALYEDASGDLWAGAVNGGLVRFREGKFTTYGPEQGFHEKVVNSILEDEFGFLWVTSNHGVFRIEKTQFEDLDQRRSNQLRYTIFGVTDGLRSADCTGGAQPSSWKTRDGRMLFPTLKGFVVINPSQLTPSSPPPPTLIEEMLVDARRVPLNGFAEIAPGARVLEIQYTGLDFSMASKLQFRYKLEGFDADWNKVGTRRTAYYNNLPPGQYRFRVAAADENGNWNDAGAEIAFRLKPQLYQTYWFWAVLLAALGGVFYVVHRYRVSLANEHYVREIALQQPTAMMVHEPSGKMVMVNRQFTESCGYVLEEIPTLYEWFERAYPDPEYRKQNQLFWEQALRPSSDASVASSGAKFEERRITCKNGVVREMEMHFTRLRELHIVTIVDVTDRKRSEAALRQSEQQLRALATRLEAVREEERSYISREIHEEIGQALAGIMFDLKAMANRPPATREDLQKRTAVLLESVTSTIQSVRTLATSFRPTALDHLDLVDALEWQTRDFQIRTGVHCEIVERPRALALGREMSVALFRIYQDTLTNISEQGQTRNVRTSIKQENDCVILEVHGDGTIFPNDDAKQAHTLDFVGMRERAYRLGGDIGILVNGDGGTTLRTTLPLDKVTSPEKSQYVSKG
jgi:PAS domain S-box-containing protein